jgi:hypothetical protein
MKYIVSILAALFFPLATMAQYQLNGVTTNLGGGTYQLTPAVNDEFGAIWYKFQQNLNNPFNIEGKLNFGNDPGGADGICFVMQNSCLSAGGAGGGVGYKGMTGQSIAIEFDTYQNIAGSGAELNDDPAYDHIAVEKAGDVAHGPIGTPNPNTLVYPVQMDAVLSNVKTGNWYDFQINYNPSTNLLKVYFNGSLRVSFTYDIKNNIFGGNQWVYWGFTSSTGGKNNIQQISINGTKTTHPLADTTICTGTIPITLDPFTNLRGTNLSLNNPTFASSEMSPSSQAVDGNITSRWESNWSDPQWIYVDLQSPTDLDSVVIYWEAAYASNYLIQTSNDAVTWTTNYSTNTGSGGKEKIALSVPLVRYVRMYGNARATGYGYSIYEFQVYGQPHYLWSPNNGTISDIYGSSVTLSPIATTTYSVMIPDVCLGFTNVSFTVTVDCTTLPVNLTNFTAMKVNNQIKLFWETEFERNTSLFNVLKSTDGIHFTSIGNVPALGNSSSRYTYNFTDNELWEGTVYYKIEVQDIDGSKSESEIKAVSNDRKPKPSIESNVFTDYTYLIIPDSSPMEYYISDMIGQIIETANLDRPSFKITIGKSLAPGNYILIVRTESDLISQRITKLK